HLAREGGRMGPLGSARALAAIAAAHAFTVLDVWLTDAYGHAQAFADAKALLERVDAALGHLVTDPAGAVARGVTVLVTSDHGNVEDLGVATHTRNPVPLYAAGPGAAAFDRAASLPDVAPAARSVLAGSGSRAATAGRARHGPRRAATGAVDAPPRAPGAPPGPAGRAVTGPGSARPPRTRRRRAGARPPPAGSTGACGSPRTAGRTRPATPWRAASRRRTRRRSRP